MRDKQAGSWKEPSSGSSSAFPSLSDWSLTGSREGWVSLDVRLAIGVHSALNSGFNQNTRTPSRSHPLDLKRNLLSPLGHGCVFPPLQAPGFCSLSGWPEGDIFGSPLRGHYLCPQLGACGVWWPEGEVVPMIHKGVLFPAQQSWLSYLPPRFLLCKMGLPLLTS